jgi:hypothetical protein
MDADRILTATLASGAWCTAAIFRAPPTTVRSGIRPLAFLPLHSIRKPTKGSLNGVLNIATENILRYLVMYLSKAIA